LASIVEKAALKKKGIGNKFAQNKAPFRCNRRSD